MLIRRTSLLLTAAVCVVLAQKTPDKQAPKAAAKWTQPRTPWGDPDLQGIWNNSTITELERPAALAGKQVLADGEAAALEAKIAESRVDAAPRAGDPGTYNQAWFDRGTKVVPTKRTSLIIDPPDGKLPPLTAAGQKWQQDRFKKLGPTATGSSGNGPFDSYAEISVVTRCITRGMPNAMLPAGTTTTIKSCRRPA